MPDPYGPTEQEIRDWAAKAKTEREAWVRGPDAKEQKSWARAQRRRRILEAAVSGDLDNEAAERELDEAIDREWRVFRRKIVAESGRAFFALSGLLLTGFSALQRAGEAWQEGYKRRRV